MHYFQKVLFVSFAQTDEENALVQALSIAHVNQGSLKMLSLRPPFSGDMACHENSYRQFLQQISYEALARARQLLNLSEQQVQVEVDTELGNAPSARIIRHVLRDDYDLVIKAPESVDSGRGFQAVDMELLRKCPCPVWLSRPVNTPRRKVRIAVAVDPHTDTPEGHALSLHELRIARELSDVCDGDLRVVSCWDFPYEAYLRGNTWIELSDLQLTDEIRKAEDHNRRLLELMITESAIGGRFVIHHIRGRPEEAIPVLIEQEGIHVLVMGTVARTGIPGFVMGNTAENILQKLSCSLLALKPPGFVSPVKAY